MSEENIREPFLYNNFFTAKKNEKWKLEKLQKKMTICFSKNVFFTKNKNVKNRKLSFFSSEWSIGMKKLEMRFYNFHQNLNF